MAFKLVVETPDGNEVAHEVSDARVRQVNFATRNGGAGTIGIPPHVTEVLVTFDLANPNEVYVDDLDAMAHKMDVTPEEAEAHADELAEKGKRNENTGAEFFTPEAVEAREKLEAELTVPGGGGQREGAESTEAEFEVEESTPKSKSKAKSNA